MTEVSACLSVPTLDEKAWRATEPHTPHPRARLEAVAELNRAGHPDRRADRAADARDQRRAGAGRARSSSWRPRPARRTSAASTLFLRGAVREIFFDWLREHRPDLVPRYERLYAKGAYLSAGERRKIELAAGAPWLRRMDRDPFRAATAARGDRRRHR